MIDAVDTKAPQNRAQAGRASIYSRFLIVAAVLALCAMVYSMLPSGIFADMATSDAEKELLATAWTSSSAGNERPSGVVLVVRSLEGAFLDCGCHGTAVGGLPRIASLAADAPESLLVLTGDLLTSAASTGADRSRVASIRESTQAAIYTLCNTLEVFPGKVVWVPSPGEIQALKDMQVDYTQLQSYAVASDQQWTVAGVSAVVASGVLLLDGVPLPGLSRQDTRARRVAVGLIWKGKKVASDVTKHPPGLGSLYGLKRVRPEDPEIQRRFAHELGEAVESARAVIGVTSVTVSRSLREHPHIRTILIKSRS